MFSTPSVDTNLARPFKAGKINDVFLRRVATREIAIDSIVATRRRHPNSSPRPYRRYATKTLSVQQVVSTLVDPPKNLEISLNQFTSLLNTGERTQPVWRSINDVIK